MHQAKFGMAHTGKIHLIRENEVSHTKFHFAAALNIKFFHDFTFVCDLLI